MSYSTYKTHVFFLALLALPAFFALPALASATWVQQDSGTMQSVRGITKSGDALVAVGNSGNMMRSIDSGVTWALTDKISSAWWHDVVTETDGDLVAVGESGTYAESSNAGETWKSLSLGTSANLYAIDRSASYGYVVGAEGTVLYYVNSKWYNATPNVTEILYDVQDNADGTAWIVGGAGRLLKAFNSGLSWSNFGRIGSENLFGVYFASSANGWIVGDNGTFKKTTDSGSSWSDVSVSGLSTQDLFDIQASGDHIVIVGDKIVLQSQDAGATWNVQDFTSDKIVFYSAVYDANGELWIAGSQDDVKSSVFYYDVEEEVPSDTSIPSDQEETPEVVEVETANLIKLICEGETDINHPCRAVYYYATDGMRHAFPNEKVFFTWFENFDEVIEVSADFLSDIPLGKNVTYHPGTRMVKFQSVPTVYAVETGGVLRAIAMEEVAKALYGEDWNQRIDDIPDAFYGNYQFGEMIDSEDDYDPDDWENFLMSLDDNF